MDPNMQYYDPQATCDDGSCVGWVVGCMDPNSFNYSPTATQDDGSCIAKVFGCTTANAHNFDPSANTDDGSCIAKIGGCADPMAYNYNQSANRDCNDNPIGGGNNQQSFSGHSNASGGPGNTLIDFGNPHRSSPRGRMSWPPEPWNRSAQGGYMRPIVYDNYTGTGQGLATGSSGMTRNPNAISYLPPIHPTAYGRSGEYNPDVPITNRVDEDWDAVRGTDYYSNGTGQGLATGSTGMTRFSRPWPPYDANERTRGYGRIERDAPTHSRAISEEWTWPY